MIRKKENRAGARLRLRRERMKSFDHEKLDVYQASIELVILIDEIIDLFPRGRSYLADQLQRAGTSVPLNIAEEAIANTSL